MHVPQHGPQQSDYAGRPLPTLNPYHADCPECGAAQGSYCSASYRDGVGFVVHQGRLEAARQARPCTTCVAQ